MTWRERRRASREVDTAWRGVNALFPMRTDDAPDDEWDVFAVVDEMLAAVASRGSRGFRVAASLAFADAVRRLGEHESTLDDAQRAAVGRLRAAVAAAESASSR
ncbi:hypothetical protein GCM10025864_32270 [Luteimicrobium album]|uniref:Uncharacterized protein n=1 Tax=Luteimicrobium album TaxID=1054550 RepID=A0ABQ6I3X8_9MICO|nr:hypothetical protein [Luteimicrobium album]GMA25468.1 hypothetical protein GCM10025864_32270 [Luteimicrobium album]